MQLFKAGTSYEQVGGFTWGLYLGTSTHIPHAVMVRLKTEHVRFLLEKYPNIIPFPASRDIKENYS